MKLITFSTLYPNAAQPAHGLFVEARLRQLRTRHDVDASVIAPVPWFPFRAERFGLYGRYARAPSVERRDGVDVYHPRYLVVPKIGMRLGPGGLTLGAAGCLKRLLGKHDSRPLLDAHYFYPDGVAAARLAERHGLPLVITARGSDINLLPQFPAVRRSILWAAERAAAIVAVSAALATRMREIGLPGDKIRVVRNGVDLERFVVRDRAAARLALGVEAPLLLSVGNLYRLKGHDLVIRALAELPDSHLVIAGEGPERAALEGLARDCGVARRVRFVGSVKQSDLVAYYNAADALVLASCREGMANVLLESLACATPVVVTDVGGNAEVVADPVAGRVLEERSVGAIAAGVRELRAAAPERSAIRAYAGRFAWPEATAKLHRILREVEQ